MSIAERGNAMTESRFRVIHVRVTSDRPFADVQAAFERGLGRLEPDVLEALAEGGDPAAVRARLTNADGASRFGRFRLRPEGGTESLSPEEAAEKTADFLAAELSERLSKGPVGFGVLVQLAEGRG